MGDVPGKIHIASDVIAIIAGIEAVETEGIAGLSGGGTNKSRTMKNAPRGIEVNRTDDKLKIDLNIIMDYGVRIPEVSWHVQNNVKKKVEYMTGVTVYEVNIHIQGIDLPKQ